MACPASRRRPRCPVPHSPGSSARPTGRTSSSSPSWPGAGSGSSSRIRSSVRMGDAYGWYPLQGASPPAALTVGGWLAGARHWHFAFAWLFVANAVVYVGVPLRERRVAAAALLPAARRAERLGHAAPRPAAAQGGAPARRPVQRDAAAHVHRRPGDDAARRAVGARDVQARPAPAPDRAPGRLRRRARHPPPRARGARAVHGRPRRPGAAPSADARRHDRRQGRSGRRRPRERNDPAGLPRERAARRRSRRARRARLRQQPPARGVPRR